MDYTLHTDMAYPYLELLPYQALIASEQDALDWVAACGEQGAPRLLLQASNLHPDFYDLGTGLAGGVLLKFSNYRLKVALVLTFEQVGTQGRFAEFAGETRRSREFRIFYERAAAVAWLTEAQ